MEEVYNDVIIDKDAENRIFGKTFFWMFLGLLGTAIVSAYTYYSGLFAQLIMNGYFNILIVLELVVVLVFSLLFKKLPAPAVGILYFLYSMLNGVTFCTIFAAFELSSIVYLFAVSSLAFAVLGFIGYNTKKDLSSWQTYITVFLIGGIILTLINVFIIKSPGLDLFLDWVILALYLDFINIFIRILSIFGRSRD